MTKTNQINTCEVCGNTELTTVLDLGLHPLCDDLIPVGNERRCNKYPIQIVYCQKCNTAHQHFQVPKHELFPKTYHYRSRFTADVLSGMDSLVESVEALTGSLKGRIVLDIGCNDGSLLDRFSAKGAKTLGVEPTGAHSDAKGREHIIINEFFSESTAKSIINLVKHVDLITFTNVFAHIEDLPALLHALTLLMHEDTILVVENHYLGAVLDRNQFDTFYHEHPRTYSLSSFIEIAQSLGRAVIEVQFPQRYGGNVRVFIGKVDSASEASTKVINTTIKREANFYDEFAQMRTFLDIWKREKKAEILTLVSAHGKLLAKAFPGRAAILVTLLGLTEYEIEAVYEKPGSLKIGHYLPGTRIPIRSDEQLFPRLNKAETLLNLAWHIPNEISNYLAEHGFKGVLVNIVD